MAFDFNDWKERNINPLSWWLSKLSEDQKKLLKEVKNSFDYHLSDFSETKRTELQLLLDHHISFDAQKQLLEKRHGNIINDENYIPYYRGVLNEDTNLIDDKLYNEFIMCFEVVGISSPWVNELEESKAREYLENIATLNIIEGMKTSIEDVEIFGDPRFRNIPKWQRVLAKLANRFYTELKPTTKFTVIHIWMEENKLLTNIDNTVYREFVRNNYKNQLLGRNFSAFSKINEDHKKYLNNKPQLDQIYKSK